MRPALAVWAATLILTGGARAQSAPQTWTLTGQVNAVSDYRFRGVSLSDDRPAFQAWLTLNGPDGVYAQAWTSTIADYGGARDEWDGIIGERRRLAGLDFDVSAIRYGYPAANRLSFWEFPLTISRTQGRWTFTGGAAYTPPQGGTAEKTNIYSYGAVVWHATGRFALSGSFGREDGAFGENKLDWSFGETLTAKHLLLSLTYVGVRRTHVGSTVVVSVGAGF